MTTGSYNGRMQAGPVRDHAVHGSGGMWTIGDVARLSGVTTRTLRHYDSLGLLRAVGVAAGGRRLYGREELLRLQQILVLRELDVDLATVAQILSAHDGHGNAPRRRADLLREHHTRLVAERDRFDRLAATVASTLESLEGGHDMAAKDLYAGFDNSQYDAEARERWGDDAVKRGNDAWTRLGADGQAAHHRESQDINAGLAELLAHGADPADERVQALVARHYAQ
ncbi:MAG TPA: MerR family transcriptional regulator, partial [Actinotalea sp.]